jgi:FkbM family methyltransferase
MWTREVVKKLVYTPGLNAGMRRCLRPFSAFLPRPFLLRFPVLGTVSIAMQNGNPLYLKMAGLDEVSGDLYWYGLAGYEPETLRTFYCALAHASTFIDIGANIGIFALLAAANNARRSVHAIEPVPAVCDRLAENVKLNRLRNVQVHRCALADFEGTIDLYVPGAGIPTSASTRAGFRHASEVVPVPAQTLDGFVAAKGLTSVDLIKIDTESTEPQVLAGGRQTLVNHRPLIICEVLAGLTEGDLHVVLEGLDYHYFWITSDGLVRKERIEGDSAHFRNYLFVPESKLALLGSFVPGVT